MSEIEELKKDIRDRQEILVRLRDPRLAGTLLMFSLRRGQGRPSSLSKNTVKGRSEVLVMMITVDWLVFDHDTLCRNPAADLVVPASPHEDADRALLQLCASC